MNKLKIIRLIAEGVGFLLIVLLAIATGVKDSHLRTYRQQAKADTRMIDSLSTRNRELSGLTAISVSCHIEMKTTNVLGLNQINAQNVAKEIAYYTRGEILDSLKSTNNSR